MLSKTSTGADVAHQFLFLGLPVCKSRVDDLIAAQALAIYNEAGLLLRTLTLLCRAPVPKKNNHNDVSFL